jgi:hypothetical protein
MKLRDLPEDILTKNIFNNLDNSSLCAVGQTSRFFSSATSKAITKRKLEYLLNYESNELSLEEIKEYVDFLAKESCVIT